VREGSGGRWVGGRGRAYKFQRIKKQTGGSERRPDDGVPAVRELGKTRGRANECDSCIVLSLMIAVKGGEEWG
jgi:hypothetical protein